MEKIAFIFSCLAAFFAPFILTANAPPDNGTAHFEFPHEFEGRELRNIGLSEREGFFLRGFPGQIGRFTDGQREIIIRRVTEATRMLHPAVDCFEAVGYRTSPLPLRVGDDGKRWSCFTASKAGDNLTVCERIEDNLSNEWTDVSSWYWSSWGKGTGEWWAYTVAERE
ncbi:MAG: hypothetical protein KF855_10675 [Acidobacteria bacterium]|nr:hypothetical protein [Acidobacteriota bacterium]